jgi:hypothetical protein
VDNAGAQRCTEVIADDLAQFYIPVASQQPL